MYNSQEHDAISAQREEDGERRMGRGPVKAVSCAVEGRLQRLETDVFSGYILKKSAIIRNWLLEAVCMQRYVHVCIHMCVQMQTLTGSWRTQWKKVCTCVCMQVCTCVHTHVHTHVDTHRFMEDTVEEGMHVCMHAGTSCVHTHVRIRRHSQVHGGHSGRRT